MMAETTLTRSCGPIYMEGIENGMNEEEIKL
jgi:hypothetical protein